MMVKQPEKLFLPAIKNVPNSDLPALVYRNVLPQPFSSEQAKQLCEKNGWEKRGEWGEIKIPHFHPNTHECYAIFKGTSRIVLGRTEEDDNPDGIEVDVAAGDVVVVPAGVSHRSLYSDGGYRYIGVYPKTSPRWRNNFCRGEESMDSLTKEIRAVEIPNSDPVYGRDGPLCQLWNAVRAASTRVPSKL